MVRMRSPNFPGISLEAAIKAARLIYDKNRRAVIMREDAARDLGYSGLTGRSLKIMGALNQYELIENVSKGKVRITATAEEIFHGYPEDVRLSALHKAGSAPSLYNDIYERFEGDVPGENAVRSFLFQKGFTNAGVEKALRAFLETNRYMEIAGASESHGKTEQSAPDSPSTARREEEPRAMDIGIAAPTGPKGATFFRDAPLEYSLTSTGLALTGKTNSKSELMVFLERLKVLASVLPDQPDQPAKESDFDL